MTLGEKQRLFASLLPGLIQQALAIGYEVTLGECWRPPEMAEEYFRQGKGIRKSVHCDKLAIDLNLFKDGRYLEETVDHQALGTWWKQQHELCCWGGDWGDGNHYSLEHSGRK